MELEKDLKAYSYFMIDTDPEKLTKLINTIQLKLQTTMPGQEIVIPIAPHHALRYAPEKAKGRGLLPPTPAGDAISKSQLDATQRCDKL